MPASLDRFVKGALASLILLLAAGGIHAHGSSIRGEGNDSDIQREGGRVIYLLGDSTCANADPAVSSQRGWGQLFHLFFKPRHVKVVNCAVGGTSSKSFRRLGSYPGIKGKFGKDDIVTIQFGINDGSEKPERHTSEAEFADSIRAFIADVRAAGARPVLITPVASRSVDRQGKLRLNENREKRAKIIIRIGEEEGVPVIDCLDLTKKWLEALGAEDSKNYYCYFAEGAYPDGKYASGRKDDTHLNQDGAYEVASIMARELVSTFPELRKYYVKARYKAVVAEFGQITYHTGSTKKGK